MTLIGNTNNVSQSWALQKTRPLKYPEFTTTTKKTGKCSVMGAAKNHLSNILELQKSPRKVPQSWALQKTPPLKYTESFSFMNNFSKF